MAKRKLIGGSKDGQWVHALESAREIRVPVWEQDLDYMAPDSGPSEPTVRHEEYQLLSFASGSNRPPVHVFAIAGMTHGEVLQRLVDGYKADENTDTKRGE